MQTHHSQPEYILNDLIRKNLRDDFVPTDLRLFWEEILQSLRKSKICGSNTLDIRDPIPPMICIYVYTKFKKKDGTYSCQLVIASTKVPLQGISLHRAEHLAALINTYPSKVVEDLTTAFIKNQLNSLTAKFVSIG